MILKDQNLNNILSLDKSFKIEDNVYYVEKAFMVNSVLKVLHKGAILGKLSEEQLNNYMNILVMFVNNKIELYWEGNKLYAKGG